MDNSQDLAAATRFNSSRQRRNQDSRISRHKNDKERGQILDILIPIRFRSKNFQGVLVMLCNREQHPDYICINTNNTLVL